MEWVKLSKARIKKISEVDFVIADCGRDNENGPRKYKILKEIQYDLFPRLLNLHLSNDEEVCKFVSNYGFLGLYWHYIKYWDGKLPLDPLITQIFSIPLHRVFSKGELIRNRLASTTKLNQDIYALDVLWDENEWTMYREPLQYIKKESYDLAEYAKMLLNWETRTKDSIIISDTVCLKEQGGKKAFVTYRPFYECELKKIDKKFYYMPVSNTLIEYAYNMLPILLNDGLPLHQCESETCQRFFISTKKKHCTTKCRNAQGKREDRQRTAIIGRLNKGKSLEEAARGYDWQKVLAWREKGLI
ncbi:MAG: hypothetical protein NC238_14055 [Dehalobacter sp.]|nr:hypothetical protein [Dehalobacter sp.]